MLLTRMSQLSSQMIELKLAVQQLEKTKVNCDVNSDFEQNWKLLLPCNTKEEFQEFDNKIKTDQDFRQKLVNFYNKLFYFFAFIYLLRMQNKNYNSIITFFAGTKIHKSH